MSSTDDDHDESWTELLEHLSECLQEEDYQEAVRICEKLYCSNDLPPKVKNVVVEIHCKSELHSQQFENVLTILKDHKDSLDSDLRQSLTAYSHYRMKRYDQARREATSNSMAQAHIVAQSRYRLHDTDDVYSDVLNRATTTTTDDDRDERLQTMVNAVAVELSRATPYVTTEGLPVGVDSFRDDEHAYDLWYNVGSYHLLTADNTAAGITLLERAERASIKALEQDGLEADEIASEVAPVHYQSKSWSRLWSGHGVDDEVTKSSAPAAVHAIQKVNRSLAHSSLNDLPELDPTWTALQQRLYHYNRAVLQLRHKQYTDCLHTCQAFLSSSDRKKDKSHIKMPPYANDQDEAWWRAYVIVLQAHANAPQHPDKAIKLLQDEIQYLQGISSSSAVDHALAHVLLHLAHVENRLDEPTNMINVLLELPESIRQRKAVVATLASLYEDMGNHEQATRLLQEQQGGAALVDFYMAQGEYETAAKLCEESGDKVRLVEALSYFDPARAQEVWEKLAIEEDADLTEEELDGAALEERDLPRRSRKAVATGLASAKPDESKQKKKSKEAVLRQRARKKEAYLQKLISEGKYNPERPTNPDPERWIPKHERSYNRRRRQRGQNKAHQGGGSEKDAAKLDVAARKGENAVDSGGPSTAHLGVAGESKRAGRRR